MKKLALSSEIYLIKASELKRLPRAAEINGNISGILAASAAPQAFSAATASPQVSSAAPGASLSPAAKSAAPFLAASAAPQVSSREITVLLNADAAAASGDKEVVPAADVLLSGAETVSAAADGDFLPVRFAYRSYPAWQAFFINLIKPVKRKFYSVFPSTYTTTLACLLANNITRGERNEQNAYQWTNKKWQISREEAHRRYSNLYNSIKANGYDAKSPMLVMLNRKFGVKDQLLQGHHRIGICKALNVNEVSISFWAVPRSFGFFKLFTKRKIS